MGSEHSYIRRTQLHTQWGFGNILPSFTVGPVLIAQFNYCIFPFFQLFCEFNDCVCANCMQGWAINIKSLRIKSLRTLYKLTIRNYQTLAIKTGPTVIVNFCMFLKVEVLLLVFCKIKRFCYILRHVPYSGKLMHQHAKRRSC